MFYIILAIAEVCLAILQIAKYKLIKKSESLTK